MRAFTLFSEGSHRWMLFGQDPEALEATVDTNQVVICADQSTMLLDPGGMEIFPSFMGALVHELEMTTVRHIFLSHQDPDVGSALPLWRQVCPRGTAIYAPQLWTSYIAHFDAAARFTPIPDEGMDVAFSPQVTLRFLPAHYMHSSAAFCVYDPRARMLFSGDIGAALVPPQERSGIWVRNFADHVPYMTGFHRRYLGSREARDAWVAMVRQLNVDMLVPQHGLAFQGQDVTRFLDWLSSLSLGTGVDAYRRVAGR
jgi:flavorubredoxin